MMQWDITNKFHMGQKHDIIGSQTSRDMYTGKKMKYNEDICI